MGEGALRGTGRCWRGRKVCEPHLSSQVVGGGGLEPESSDVEPGKCSFPSHMDMSELCKPQFSHLQNGGHHNRTSHPIGSLRGL